MSLHEAYVARKAFEATMTPEEFRIYHLGQLRPHRRNIMFTAFSLFAGIGFICIFI